VLGPDTVNLQQLSHLLKTAFETLAGLHEILDVVDAGEVEAEQREKILLILWQILTCEDLEEVSKIVPGMEGKPFYIVHQNNS